MITKVVAVAVVVIVMLTTTGIVNSVYISHVLTVRFAAQSLLPVALACRQETFAANCALLGYYAASSGKLFPMFRDNLSAPLSGLTIRIGQICCPETSARNYHHSLRNKPKRAQFSATSRRKLEVTQETFALYSYKAFVRKMEGRKYDSNTT